MKRLAWIFIAIFCTACAQVQPVESLLANHESCGCCEIPGNCGMPDCALPAGPAEIMLAGASGLDVTQPATKGDALARTRPTGRFFTADFASRVRPPATRAPAPMARPAVVPLFKAHRAFLI